MIPTLARILGEYRTSMGDPVAGVMFHNGSGERMDMDKLAQRVIRPAVEAIGLPSYGWHGFRRGIASNPVRVGGERQGGAAHFAARQADRHPRERYIKVFDPAVLEAMQRMELTVQALRPNWPATGQQLASSRTEGQVSESW